MEMDRNTLQDDVWEVFAEYFDMMTHEDTKPDEGLKEDLVMTVDEKFREHGYIPEVE